MKFQIPKVLLAVIYFLIGWLASPAFAADPKLNVDVTIGWNNTHRLGHWAPLEVAISYTGEKPMEAHLEVITRQGLSTDMVVHQDFVLTPNRPLLTHVVALVGEMGDAMQIRLRNARGRVIWEDERRPASHGMSGDSILDPQWFSSLAGAEAFVGVAGSPIPSLTAIETEDANRWKDDSGTSYPRSFRGYRPYDFNQEQVRIGDGNHILSRTVARTKPMAMLPIDWAGYEALDVLVLRDSQADAAHLDPLAAAAIVQWVRDRGGSLLLVLDSGALPADSLLARLLPFDVHALKPVDIDSRQVLGEPEGDSPSAVQSLLGGVNSENRNSPLPVQSLLGGVNRENPRWQWQGEPAYFGWGLVGFGRVGVLGFNPDAVTGAAAAGRQRLWRQCINRLMPHRELMPAGGEDQGETRVRSRLPMDNVDQNSMHLHGILQHLMQIRQLRLFSGWVVVGMLGALALLIGPVDYFLLKRLNRQPWTHVTMVCYLALFTLGAYIGVSQFRAGNSQVRAVTVTDAIQGQTAWTTTYAGIFASQGGAYAFHPAAADGWWRDLSTTNDNWYSQPGLADRTLDCWQGDGACTPGALSIRVWTMQCMIGEWPCHKLPLKVRAWGQNGDVQVQVENLADTSVEIVALAGSGESWAKVIPAHESSKSILSGLSSGHDFDQSGPSGKLLRYPDWVPDQKDSPSGFAHAQGAPSISQAALHTGGCGQRLEAMAGMLDKGRVIVIACYKDSPMPFDVPGRQLDKSHLEYVRILTNIEEVK